MLCYSEPTLYCKMPHIFDMVCRIPRTYCLFVWLFVGHFFGLKRKKQVVSVEDASIFAAYLCNTYLRGAYAIQVQSRYQVPCKDNMS